MFKFIFILLFLSMNEHQISPQSKKALSYISDVWEKKYPGSGSRELNNKTIKK